MSKIHVVIPVYNAKKYLQQAVDSVLDQPYKGIDIVLVDDGSTDGSAELCDEIAQREERVNVIHQANGGVSSARNTGIEHVLKNAQENDYIAFLDADDFWVSNTIKDGFGSISCSDEIITFSMYYTNSMGSRYRKNPLNIAGRYDDPRSVSFWGMPHMWCSFYKIQLVKKWKLRFSTLTSFGEDECFKLLAMYYATSCVAYNNPLVCYRHNVNSIMHTSGKKPIVPFVNEINALLNELRSRSLTEESYVKRMKFYCCWLLLEMSEEYYRNLHFGSEPYLVIEKHELGQQFSSYASNDHSSDKVCQRIYMMLYQKRMFKFKQITQGVIEYVVRVLSHMPIVKRIYETMRYPVSSIGGDI